MTETTRQTDRLRQLQELRAFLDTQIEELTAREHHRKLELCCSADKTLAGAGEPVLIWGVVHNSGCEAVENLHLELRLPSGLQLLPEGGGCTCHRLPVPALDLPQLGPGETRALSVRVAAEHLPGENPIRIDLDCTVQGEPCPGASLRLWITGRSCSRKQAGCSMADALAQWSLAQLFGLSECEIALLLEYLQEHRETLLEVAAGRCSSD